MDLFHAVTQSIDQILTCHLYEGFRDYKKMSTTNTTNTSGGGGGDKSKLMETAPGGESTQYESIKEHTIPPARQAGQLGKNGPPSATEATSASDRGERTADNIRYGQNISESGMGGMTNSTGAAAQQGGYGGTKRDPDQEEAGTRKSQGYGPGSGVGG